MIITTHTGQKPRSMTLITETEFMQAAVGIMERIPKTEFVKGYFYAEAITKMQEELYGRNHSE